jgi:hypothetical protein
MPPGEQRLPEKAPLLVEIEERIFLFVELFVLAGHHVQLHGMRSDDLEFDVAFRAAQNFPFFDFVFVEVNFGIALGAPDHGATSLLELFGDSVRVLYIGTRGGVL